MQKFKLTDSAVIRAELPAGSTDMVIWDSDVAGFGVRLRPIGKSWILAYRPSGAGRRAHTKKMKLATVSAVAKVADARRLAQVALGRIAQGADPLAERAKEKRRGRARLCDLLDRYERDLVRRGYVNRKDVMSSLRTKMARLLTRDVQDITGRDLAAIMEALQAKKQSGAAEGFRTHARAFFTWCVVSAKVLSTNPLAGHRKERATRADRIAKTEKGRALLDAELGRVWQAADPATTFGRLIRFYILTGCRRGEGAGLTWAMVDERAQVLDLPAVFVKQGRGHKVPIAAQLRGLLGCCIRDARSDLVFPSMRSGGEISGWTKLMTGLRTKAGVDFTLHDLRRTFRTGLSRLGIDVDTAELAIGHARADLEAIYNRDEALDRLRDAFERWAARAEIFEAAAESH
ncbi:tyrosine-type recombinase/integrase [Methylobacterium sp. Leaf108]|uniref:tyrosine-type recombinase/integrase n=1 Tax=Methylobacterium sp. Leaf108 TaxID=1736256 RepID=UPI00070133D1|nr:tyrosine-type recombinase/integrase [Methylobacterium sp. Leaf108]KQP59733.1 hypothetical protein ASF39_16450 [Methylobacterium sp. Leaf108]